MPTSEPIELHRLLRSPGYLGLLLLSALIGVPISLVAFGFVSLEHAVQDWVWGQLPRAVGYPIAPWWWPLPALAVAGVLVALVVVRLPGRGGHVPVHGLGGGPTPPRELPGVVLAALASLSLGAVLGPEAPLMAIGSGLAMLTVRSARRGDAPRAVAVLSTAGSAAAISTIFGSPLIAVVLLIEAVGLGGPQLFAVILPSLVASGVGAVVFTGFGKWTGLGIGALSLPTVPPNQGLGLGDFLWAIPLAVVIACGVVAAMALGRRLDDWTRSHTARRTIGCAVAVGACAAGYALATGRSPAEAALSGQATLAALAAHPDSWPVPALLMLLLFKGLGWGISLGSLRGGPAFPALLLGAALGVACSGLPGFGAASGIAVGMAAGGAAALRLPVAAVVLAAVLMGEDAANQMPLMIIATVVAFAAAELLHGPWMGPASSEEQRDAPQG
ncbi:chloride channel protein [Nonomuraea sp. NPDC050536]|uniref:chloride channel protein n=1 Tax=Nonomuraea sp. NPDC050536 TaxID=3364366 RepID=UPI0037C74517